MRLLRSEPSSQKKRCTETVYVRYKAELQSLEHRLTLMKEDIRDIGEAAKDVRDAQSDQDNISLQTNEFSRDDDIIARRSGRDAARLDEKVRLNSPLFMAKMLEELCVTYLELDNLLLKKPANKRNDLEPAWREGEGRDGTGEWGFEVHRSTLEKLTSMLGIGMQNDINDIFFIAQAPIRRFSRLHHMHR